MNCDRVKESKYHNMKIQFTHKKYAYVYIFLLYSYLYSLGTFQALVRIVADCPNHIIYLYFTTVTGQMAQCLPAEREWREQ